MDRFRLKIEMNAFTLSENAMRNIKNEVTATVQRAAANHGTVDVEYVIEAKLVKVIDI